MDEGKLFRQHTIGREGSISGVGIHTGRRVRAKLLPAPPDAGITFRRTDAGGVEIPALASEVTSVELATTLGRDDVTVSTVEHLLAALRVAEVDNAVVELDGPEVPVLDGSALPWVRLLQAVGTEAQEAPRRIMAVTAPVEVAVGAKRMRVSPYPGLRLRYTIDFASAAIGHQELDLEVDPATFERELAPARTFAQARDVAVLKSRGLGRGGHEDNCLVFGEEGPLNARLRFADEPVRHKALDAVGDLALIGASLWALVEVERGGHQLHFSMIEALRARPDRWTWMEGTAREEVPTAVRRASLALA